MFFSILALADDGEEVIYPNPGFPIYESVINFLGAKAVPIKLREENEFRLDVGELKGLITKRTKMDNSQLPRQPHRWSSHLGGFESDRGAGGGERHLRALG